MLCQVLEIVATGAVSELDPDFERRVRETERLVFGIAYAVLANSADAEEVAQEAFLRAYRRRATLRRPEGFRAWVSRIAFRLALNRRRSRLRRQVRDERWQLERAQRMDGQRALEDQLFLDRVGSEIERLPPKLRAVLLLCAVEDLDVSEVARILRIPPGTVRSRLHLARKRLLQEIES